MGYTKQAIKGVSWMGLLQIALKGVAIIKIAFIVRILTPSDLGVFGMTMVVVGLFEIITNIGIETFLIQSKENISKYINTLWVIQMGRGFCLMLIISLCAIPASLFFNTPQLVMLIILGSLNPFVKSLENPYIVTFQKNLKFNVEFFYRLFITFTDITVTVTLAYYTRSPIGLVIGLLLSSGAGVCASWLLIKNKPQITFNVSYLKKFIQFFKSITLLSTFTYFISQIDYIIIGKLLGSAQLGIYQTGQKFSSTPMIEMSDISNKVAFPVYANFADDKPRLKRAYLRTLLSVMAIEGLIMIAIQLFSHDIVMKLAGTRWAGAEPILNLLAVYGFIASVTGTIGSLFLSLGRQDILTKLACVRLVIILPLMFFCITRFGLPGAVYASLGNLILVLPWVVLYIYKNLDN